MDYMTVREAAGKWGISERRVQKYCAQGRIEGRRKFGYSVGNTEDCLKTVRSPKERTGKRHTKQGKERRGFLI